MYSCSASSGVESMNRANMDARKAMAIDMLNSALILIRLESKHYSEYQKMAWKESSPLTPKGMEEMKSLFEDININDFIREVEEKDDHYRCIVSRHTGEKSQRLFETFVLLCDLSKSDQNYCPVKVRDICTPY